MDNNCSGDDSFGGFSAQKHSSVDSSVIVSVNNNAAASESARRSRLIAFHHENADTTAALETTAPKNKRVSRVTSGGLRQLSAMVCNTVERRGRTTYSQVADDVIAEFSGNDTGTAKSLSEFEEKNIRRRVYDALNVIEALDIIKRDRKEIIWMGLQGRNIMDSEGMKAECVKLINRIGRKMTYLKDLEEQIADLQNLVLHNKQLLKGGNTRPEGFSLPFILAQTSADATVEIEISEDMHLVHFDFDSAPFFLHDDAYILKLLRCHQRPEITNVSESFSAYSSQQSGIACGGTRPFCWNSETDTPNSKMNKS